MDELHTSDCAGHAGRCVVDSEESKDRESRGKAALRNG